MRRYIDFRAEDWHGRTDSRMQAARWGACMEGVGDDPPLEGVIDSYTPDQLEELLHEGWVLPWDADLSGREDLGEVARQVVMDTLEDDVDCLATEEYMLIQRMLIEDGSTVLQSVPELEAAYTLRMRLWCDLGTEDGEPVVRLDGQIRDALPDLMMRRTHMERRARIFVFEGMLYGMLYAAGYLDDRMPCGQFIKEVLHSEDTPEAQRLARNFLEATFDTYEMLDSVLLVHEALADPEVLAPTIAERGIFQVPEMNSNQMLASMNGMLPEEIVPDEKLQRVLYGALRPEYDPGEAASDLRFLVKQGAPESALQEIMSSMLMVLPTIHMDEALSELSRKTPTWVYGSSINRINGTPGVLH